MFSILKNLLLFFSKFQKLLCRNLNFSIKLSQVLRLMIDLNHLRLISLMSNTLLKVDLTFHTFRFQREILLFKSIKTDAFFHRFNLSEQLLKLLQNSPQ